MFSIVVRLEQKLFFEKHFGLIQREKMFRNDCTAAENERDNSLRYI